MVTDVATVAAVTSTRESRVGTAGGAGSQRSPVAPPAPHSIPVSLVLHLLPGFVTMAAYLALLPLAATWTLPSAAALGAAALLCTAPTLAGILRWARRHGGHEPVLALRQVPQARAVAGWATLILVLAAAAFLLLSPANDLLEQSLFSAWPQGWKPQLGAPGGSSRSAVLGTALVVLLGSALAAPVMEELYFRSFLLPRMPKVLGRTAPVAHTVLFALYHLWTPWLAPTRILGVLPLTYVALRTRSVVPGLVAHVVLNLLDVAVILGHF